MIIDKRVKKFKRNIYREIFTLVELNIRIRGNIFQIYSPISWKNFIFINTVSTGRKCNEKPGNKQKYRHRPFESSKYHLHRWLLAYA